MTAAMPVDGKQPLAIETVEALVRRQLSTSLGGRRGMLEAGIPGLVFTLVWLPTKQLELALVVSLVVAGCALLARLIQRGPTQYVFNALFSIGIGWVFVRWAQNSGATPDEQALNYFLPGLLISTAYSLVFAASCLSGWPMVGFMLGAATEDPFGWHRNPQIVQLCSRLTWVLMAPGAIGVLIQTPIWLAGKSGAIDTDLAVVLIAVLRTGLGWVLRLSSFTAVIWLVARNATPLADSGPHQDRDSGPGQD